MEIQWFDISELKTLYEQYEKADDIVWQTMILRHMYDLKPSSLLQKTLIKKYLELYRYDDALEMSQLLIQKNPTDTSLIHQHLFILFNSYQLNLDNLNKIANLLDTLHNNQTITDDDLNMYYALLNIAWLNTTKFEQHIEILTQSGVYTQIKTEIKEMFTLYHSFTDAPMYYLSALLSKVFFQHGYLKLSDLLAQHSLKHKSDYILPLQILSYSQFLQQHYNKATDYLEKLISLDSKNSQLYQILLAIWYYEQKKYHQAITYLAQIKDWSYYHLSLRYLLLSYIYLGQDDKAIDILQQILWSSTINDYDYYYVFDKILYNSKYSIYEKNQILIAQYVDQCIKQFGENHPICLYGKVGLYIKQKDYTSAFPLALKVSKYFPQAKIFVWIAEYYESNNNPQKAKSYYLKAITQSDSSKEKQEIVSLIHTLDY